MMINGKTNHLKKCYLCGGTKFKKRSDSVRDRPELEMLFSKVNLKVNYIKKIQRYPLANYLYWLANGKPGGHQKWHFLNSPELHAAYEKQLAAIGKCDTILASVSRY